MRKPEDLLKPMVELAALETRFRRFQAPLAIPPEVYQHFGKIRDELARWASECIAINKEGETNENQ